jgi:hypothetical protein
MPFSPSDSCKKVVSPYFPFNPYMEESNGKKIYKSPLLKTRKFHKEFYFITGEYNMQARNDMKRLMGE